MKDFYEALASSERNAAIPKEDDFFGMLIGSWYIDYMDTATGAVRKGEWHFSRVLEGMAVQDVIVLPHFEYGTTLRMYNPATRTWEIAYGYTGRKDCSFQSRRRAQKVGVCKDCRKSLPLAGYYGTARRGVAGQL